MISFCLQALANEKWEVYTTFKTYSQLEEFNDMLYVQSGNAVFYTGVDAVDSYSFTQLEGLSSSETKFIKKSEEAGVLVFIHTDGDIDLLDASNQLHSIHDLKNKSIVGDKTINNVTICGKLMYISCGFGFVEVDLSSKLITNYYFTSQDCAYSFAFQNGIYYSLTKGGLYRCDKSKDLANEENWQQIDTIKLRDVVVFSHEGEQHCWIINQDKNIHILNDDGTYLKTSGRSCYEHLKQSGNYVFSKGWGFDIIRIDNQQISYVQESPYSGCRDYYSLNDSILYTIHPERGLQKLGIGFNNRSYATITTLSEPNNYYEIAGNQISELALNNGVLAGISGYKMYSSDYTKMFLANASVNYYEDEGWSHFSEADVLAQPLATKEFRGLTNVCPDPSDKHRFYVSTLTTGIYLFDGDSLINHLLPKERIPSIFCEETGDLWAAKSLNDSTIWSYNPEENNWTYHHIQGFSQLNNTGRIIRQSNEGHRLIWALNNFPYQKSRIGILYNPTQASDNSQDQSAYISTFQDQDGNLYSFNSAINYVYDMQEDKDGHIWFLTNIGPFIVEDVVSTFNHAQKNPGIGLVKRVKVPRNDGTNLADYLLSTTACTAMVCDQFNRKWIGTLAEGLYLISADGLNEIAHYTTENAPLHTNDITALAYDEENKKLFIAGEGGVIVLHTEDIEPAEDFSNFHCYPNPLRPDYYGEIEIVGIMENSTVSITDSTGNLIWKNICKDGSISWDGRDNKGNRIAPGVYLIHGINISSSKGSICKLLVL